MGYKTIAVCSPHSFDLVKSYGADEVVDYHQGIEAAGAEIKKLAGGKGVDIGLDTISKGDSIRISQAGFGEKGGRLNLILPAQKGMEGLREDVELSNTMMYTLFGKVSWITSMVPIALLTITAMDYDSSQAQPDLFPTIRERPQVRCRHNEAHS